MTVTINLTPDWEEFVQQRIEGGLYPSIDAVVQEGLRLIRGHEELEALRADIAEGIDEYERGEWVDGDTFMREWLIKLGVDVEKNP